MKKIVKETDMKGIGVMIRSMDMANIYFKTAIPTKVTISMAYSKTMVSFRNKMKLFKASLDTELKMEPEFYKHAVEEYFYKFGVKEN